MNFAGRISALVVVSSAIAGAAAANEMVEPVEYARCAGTLDAQFAQDRESGYHEYLDQMADQAHIFMAIARRLDGGESPAALQIARDEARKHLFREGATDDDIHGDVQYCSDLHQELMRADAFTEVPPKE